MTYSFNTIHSLLLPESTFNQTKTVNSDREDSGYAGRKRMKTASRKNEQKEQARQRERESS